MDLPQKIPAVWVYTTGSSFNQLRSGGYGAFLTDAQQARLERIRQGQLLFDGKHKEYFLEESRTQFDFPRIRIGSRIVQMYLAYNVLGLISIKGADLLFGEEPLLRTDNEIQQKAITDLVKRSRLHSLFYSCAADATYEGECFLEACIHEGRVYLKQIRADQIFPEGEPGPDLQYRSYVRYELANVGTDTAKIWLLLETRYLPGSITRRAWQLDDDGKKRNEVALDQWPWPNASVVSGQPSVVGNNGQRTTDNGPAAAVPPAVQPTGIDKSTIIWIPNMLSRGSAVSDYDGAIDLQDMLNAKQTQIGRVLLKHADPKVAFPAAAFDEQGNIRADAEAFAFTDPNDIPKYITWNAELANAMADRAFVLNQLLVRTETSPVLLGLKEGAAPDAYKKVRLESFNSLTKAARKAAYWKAGIQLAIDVAQDLEQTLPGVRYDRSADGVGVELRDGIPIDDLELAQRQALLKPVGLISTERALEEQLRDPSAVAKELARIRADAAAAMPSILMSEPGAPGGEGSGVRGQGSAQEQTGAAA